MKRLILMLMVVFAFAADADAQGWLKKLGQKAVDAGKRAVERKVENKVEQTTEDVMDNVLDGKKSKKGKEADDGDNEDAEAGDDTPDADAGGCSLIACQQLIKQPFIMVGFRHAHIIRTNWEPLIAV